MNGARISRYFYLGLTLVFLNVLNASAQCPTFYDFDGAAVTDPYWYSCSGTDYTLTLQSPNIIGEWEVNWGDGSAVESGSSLDPPTSLSHTYAETVDTFSVTFTEISSGCIVEGVFVMEEATSASIQIPVGGLTQTCAPKELEFINSSTNVSETTTFTWDFGDGSPPLVFDHTNWGEIVGHMYEQNTVDCETVVTLTAENYCNTIQGGASQATFNPIRIWDLDDAAITPSAIVQCYPDTTFTFANSTERNCLFQGNIFQRQEYWNFGDYWGAGQDSIIDWEPWPPTFPQTVAYPGIGTYEVMLIDSNYCGQDTAYIEVQIVAPPEAAFTANADTICEGETVTFYNNSSDNANTFSWHFGTGGWIDSGDGNISRTYNTAGSYDVQLVVSIDGAVGACSDTATVPVVVLPAPEAIIEADNPAACDSLTVNFTDGSIGTVYNWDWVLPSGETSTLQNPPTQFFDAPGSYTASLTVSSSNGCSSTNHLDVFVHETPVVNFMPANVCQGVISTFTDQSWASPGDSIITWNWDFGGGATSNEPVATHVFPTTGTYTIGLEVGTPHCSASDTFEIEVEPVPTAQFIADIVEACGPLDVQFTNESSGAFSYVWDFDDGTMSNEEHPSHVFTNSTSGDQVFDVMLVASTEFGCTDTTIVPITVYPGAVAQFSAQSQPGCAPFDAVFSNNSQGAESYQWDFGDGSPVSNEESPIHTYVNQGLLVENFQVELVAFSASGCNDTAYTTVTAYPEPYFEFEMAADSGCSPLDVQFPNINGAVQLEWDFGDGAVGNGQSPAHTYVNNTNQPITYSIELIAMSAFSCVDTAYSEVLVNPAPVAQMLTSPTVGCSPLNVGFENLSLNASSYTWTYGDGSSSDTDSTIHSHLFVNDTDAPLEFDVTLYAETADGCVETTEETITVYPEVIADFDVPIAACAQSDVAFENLSQNATSYEWNFGDGFIDLATSPEHNYFGAGADSATYEVVLVASSSFGCTDTAIQQITIHPQPIAEFSVSTFNGCGPLDVAIENNSQNATDFNWQYGDNTGSATDDDLHSHVFSNTTQDVTTYNITLEATNDFGCIDTDQQEISVFPDVIAGFSATPEGCSPFSPDVEDTSVGAMSYEWSFGNGQMSNGQNPNIVLVNDSLVDQEFTITLSVENQYGCSDTMSQNVLVHPAPQMDFEITDIETCAPFAATFSNQSMGAESYQWTFGDGAVSADDADVVNHTYQNSTDQTQIFSVTLWGVNEYGCTDSITSPIEVLPSVEAMFFGDSVACSPLQTTLMNQSMGVATSSWYLNGEWFSDQNEPALDLTNVSNSNEEYEVMLIAENFMGCTDTLTKIFTVLASPEALFEATPQQQTFPDATVDLTNNSIFDDADFTWDFGNGEFSNEQDPGSITYNTWGTYTITLTVDNGQCADSYSREVVIDVPLPVADFEGAASGCQPVTVQFENTSEYGVQYLWDFGDGATSATENPVHTYFNPGTYSVTLMVTGHGGDMDIIVKEELIEVYPQAVAFFTANPQNVTIPSNPVNFFNLSTNADEYYWDFGDGNSSEEKNPQHYYQEIGNYSVSLIATNEYQCADTFNLSNAIIAEGGGEIVFPNAFTPSSTGPSGGYFDITENNYNNDIFFPLQHGVEEFQLLIFNRWGELIYESTEVGRGWDGYYKGELCKQDVYVWKVRATFSDGRKIERAGDVTLIQ